MNYSLSSRGHEYLIVVLIVLIILTYVEFKNLYRILNIAKMAKIAFVNLFKMKNNASPEVTPTFSDISDMSEK